MRCTADTHEALQTLLEASRHYCTPPLPVSAESQGSTTSTRTATTLQVKLQMQLQLPRLFKPLYMSALIHSTTVIATAACSTLCLFCVSLQLEAVQLLRSMPPLQILLQQQQ